MSCFIVWQPDLGQTEDDGKKITAYDAGAAAREWAERNDSDSADYSIASGTAAILAVFDCDTKVIHGFTVWSESRPAYYSKKL